MTHVWPYEIIFNTIINFMNEDKVINMLLDHEGRLERIEQNMATKQDMSGISNTLDKLVKMGEKKDDELTLATHDMRIIEDRVEVLENDSRE